MSADTYVLGTADAELQRLGSGRLQRRSAAIDAVIGRAEGDGAW